MGRRAASLIAGALLVAAVVGLHDGAAAMLRADAGPATLPPLPSPPALAAFALGQRALAADLVFLRATLAAPSARRDPQRLGAWLDAATALDPDWKAPYRWAGVGPIYHGGPITAAEVALSNRLLERGARRFAGDWELPFMLGCNYLFELPDADAAARRTGGEWIRVAALRRGAPAWVALLGASLLRQEGEAAAARRHLEQAYAASDDEATRAAIRERLAGLAPR